MIVDRLENAECYYGVYPGFVKAFEFLREYSSGLPEGRHEIDGEDLFAIAATSTGRGKDNAQLEYHQRYVDIQFSVSGTDFIGWRPLSECENVAQPFDAGKDYGLFADEPLVWIPLPPGMFTIFFPQDAHAPLSGEGEVQKIVMKVAVR